ANGQNETIKSLINQGGIFLVSAPGTFTVTSPNSTIFGPGSTNTISGTLNTTHLKVSGGSNTVAAGGAITNLSAGLDFLGGLSPSLMVQADLSSPGRIVLSGDVTFSGTDGTALIGNFGIAGTSLGQLDLGAANRTFSINEGLQPVDMLISGQIIDGAITKTGPGVLRLTAPNSFAGGTIIQQQVVEIADAAALGTGAVTFSGADAEL